MTKETYKITGEHLFKILSDSLFRKNIKQLGDLNVSNEQGFLVAQNFYEKKYMVTNIIAGQDSQSMLSLDSYECDPLFYHPGANYELIDIHSHTASDFIFPSINDPDHPDSPRGDLAGLSQQIMFREIDTRPILGIVSNLRKDGLTLLLIQEKTKNLVSPTMLEEFADDVEKVYLEREKIRPKKAVELLEGTNWYNALAINYNNKNLPKKLIQELRKFEFTPFVPENFVVEESDEFKEFMNGELD